jgi:hypothetical protein
MYKITIVLFLALLITSCQKTLRNVEDYFPGVNTVSATIQADGSVLVEGEIESEGAAPLEYIGFSCSTDADHLISERQILVETLSGGRFKAVYSGGFEEDSVYYFKAWAANEYGYAFGNTLQLSGIIATPVTPPCSLTMNWGSIAAGAQSGTFSDVSEPMGGGSLGYWEVRASPWDGPSINLFFGSALTNAVYTTTTNSSPAAGDVYVSFYQGSIFGSLEAGTKVYVNKIGPDTFEIHICDAPWKFNSSTLYLNCRMVSPS